MKISLKTYLEVKMLYSLYMELLGLEKRTQQWEMLGTTDDFGWSVEMKDFCNAFANVY